MEKPIKRNIFEIQQPNFVDFLFATYEPQRNSAGEYFFNGLDYITNEMSYMASDTEKEFVEEHGLAPVGFLEMLRIQMAKTDGFGICINNRNLKKALMSMVVDYDLDIQDLEKYYEQLVDSGLIAIINDSKGNQYATTTQTVFNWEYKMWTRWKNREYQNNHRGKNGKQDSDNTEFFPADETGEHSFEEVPTVYLDDEKMESIFPDLTEYGNDDFWNN